MSEMEKKTTEHSSNHFVIKKRNSKSLGVLTRKFIYLLQKSGNGIVDLKQVCNVTN